MKTEQCHVKDYISVAPVETCWNMVKICAILWKCYCFCSKIRPKKSVSPRTLSFPRCPAGGSMAWLFIYLSFLYVIFYCFVKDETKTTNALQKQNPTRRKTVWIRKNNLLDFITFYKLNEGFQLKHGVQVLVQLAFNI